MGKAIRAIIVYLLCRSDAMVGRPRPSRHSSSPKHAPGTPLQQQELLLPHTAGQTPAQPSSATASGPPPTRCPHPEYAFPFLSPSVIVSFPASPCSPWRCPPFDIHFRKPPSRCLTSHHAAESAHHAKAAHHAHHAQHGVHAAHHAQLGAHAAHHAQARPVKVCMHAAGAVQLRAGAVQLGAGAARRSSSARQVSGQAGA
jgi:hypothetical protein